MSFSKNPTTTAGDLIYCGSTNAGAPGTLVRLAPNTTATLKVLSQTSSVPTWVEPTVAAANVTGGTSSPASNRLGELTSSGVVSATMASNAFTTVTSRAMPGDGIYEISSYFSMAKNTTTSSVTNFGVCIASATNSTTGGVEGVNLFYEEGTAANSWTRCTMIIGPLYVKYSGSTLTLPDGSTMTLTANTIYATCRTGTFSGGTLPQCTTVLTITRIA